MTHRVRMACESSIIMVPIDRILPTRKIESGTRKTTKYRCIEASIRELGLIEPLVVYPERKTASRYLLLDGHVRLEILKQLGHDAAKCLISVDDEGFTYNHKVNRLSAIQEHFMIRRAIKNGVSEARIARTLNLDLASIKQKRDLLDGICPEAVELLREKRVSPSALREFRKAKPMRQIEMAELACASHNYSLGYAKCLIAATPQDQLNESEQPKDVNGLSAEDISRMEREMETLGRDFKLIEESHGKNTLQLVVVIGYLKGLLDNARIVRFLSQNHRELLSEFQKIVESRVLQDTLGDGT
ncbi:plasmid partitioning protein RepB C-terminal domain-containing protein [Schlesneria sp. T3-172]|uniref:plasmid partitioning protein RepB C-terminal domain-containing protein n=1 Tax=Schlesneria sphaerica TaxID=3373610 RepID=UPI0037CB99DB